MKKLKKTYTIELKPKEWCYVIRMDGSITHAHNLVESHDVVITKEKRERTHD